MDDRDPDRAGAKRYPARDAWLARRVEAALEPDLAIIDPHHHLWERSPQRDAYLLPELRADTGGGHDVVATVFVEAGWSYRTEGPEHVRPAGETEAVAALAATTSTGDGPEIRGIVAHADMTLGDAVDEVLDAHEDVAGGRLRGIRQATAHDDDPVVHARNPRSVAGMMGDPRFADAARRLAARDLTFDAWLYHPQISELTALARAVPACTFVLDHLGGPLGIGRYAGTAVADSDAWRAAIAELATCPNVRIKVGGIGMVIFGRGFDTRPEPPGSDDLVAAWRGPMEHAIECFGVERSMFESNVPPDRQSCSYVVLWNAFKKLTAGAGAAERTALFHDTAAATYRL